MSKWKRRRNDKVFQLRMAAKNARRRRTAVFSHTDRMYWMGVEHGLEQAAECLMGHYEPMVPPFIEGSPEIGPDLLSKRKPRKA